MCPSISLEIDESPIAFYDRFIQFNLSFVCRFSPREAAKHNKAHCFPIAQLSTLALQFYKIARDYLYSEIFTRNSILAV